MRFEGNFIMQLSLAAVIYRFDLGNIEMVRFMPGDVPEYRKSLSKRGIKWD